MSMFNDISCDRKGNKEECLANARVVKVLARKFGIGQWSYIGPGSEKKLYSTEENSPQGAWDHIADEMLLEFAESVKSIPPNTENWLRKFYDKNYNNDTSTEDKHETNYSMNNDTRNMHITRAGTESAQSLSHFVHLVSHSHLAQV